VGGGGIGCLRNQGKKTAEKRAFALLKSAGRGYRNLGRNKPKEARQNCGQRTGAVQGVLFTLATVEKKGKRGGVGWGLPVGVSYLSSVQRRGSWRGRRSCNYV